MTNFQTELIGTQIAKGIVQPAEAKMAHALVHILQQEKTKGVVVKCSERENARIEPTWVKCSEAEKRFTARHN